ncbi:MAG: hypothetical protein ACFB9M_18245 [Myxococcota bacterium]
MTELPFLAFLGGIVGMSLPSLLAFTLSSGATPTESQVEIQALGEVSVDLDSGQGTIDQGIVYRLEEWTGCCTRAVVVWRESGPMVRCTAGVRLFGEDIQASADTATLDMEGRRLSLKGGVTVVRSDYLFLASKVVIELSTRVMRAKSPSVSRFNGKIPNHRCPPFEVSEAP